MDPDFRFSVTLTYAQWKAINAALVFAQKHLTEEDSDNVEHMKPAELELDRQARLAFQNNTPTGPTVGQLFDEGRMTTRQPKEYPPESGEKVNVFAYAGKFYVVPLDGFDMNDVAEPYLS